MKKFIIYAGMALATFTLNSCSDFLEEESQSTYTADAFYTTEEDFEYLISAVYSAQQDAYDDTYGMFRFLNCRSDDSNKINTNLYDGGAGAFTDNANCTNTDQMYQYMYQIIVRCNTLLVKIADFEFDDSDDKDHLMGEAYAFRAWAYHCLGTWFGGVPLIVDNIYTVEETRQIARSSQDETFEQAINDYTMAASLLPESWDSSNIGRITKYAAEAMMGKLYMFMGEYSNAQTHLKKVIDSGLYEMADTYQECFDANYDNGSERVWEVQYVGGAIGEGQTFSESCMYENYQVQDGETQWAYFGGASCAISASSNLLNSYEDGDIRKDFTTVTGVTIAGVVNEHTWFKKFSYPSVVPQSSDDWDVNLPVIRYTDVMMMYAEAVNQTSGPTTEAISIINQVRARAGLDPLTSAQTASSSAFLSAIQDERRHEFAFECIRWHDLVRWGIAMDVMNLFLEDDDENGGIYQMESYQTIFAIPMQEISNYDDETVMWQNPGY